MGFDLILAYLQKSNAITIAVLVLLSLYFLLVNWLFFYRYLYLLFWQNREKNSLQTISMGNNRPAPNSFLQTCLGKSKITKTMQDFCIQNGTQEATSGLTFLSIAASTSPFIGLFGTVVSILETFYVLGSTKASISTISASIGEALVATAAGIFVAVFAYSYHLILKRKAYELVTTLSMQLDLLMDR
ncbi:MULTISPECIES: MotA/TolQ/ExbB proton channel family protein [unclassified Nitratiruptor]|uniref:MotA/TolQ/ExbB proton channel family protein n=1 Tax=unclassified Nitratiruptor TaxID=2624044 RepID=UPI001915D3B2|nr:MULTISPECIES: MotA/TolQ/ExbB proton channel family protein [unclassified Nitratiruptor]BCD60059.1 MotA/TolQ/ExbB proton channel family protein [Nitratiruptor sp. YY08-10]BCD64452.1 MotA/TolQ/ExbB proton channel family protein [Nitratiruptor sp. YY08-14]